MAAEWMSEWVRGVLQKTEDDLQREYLLIRKDPPTGLTHMAWTDNQDRNRYSDVKCFDRTRVELRDWPVDYIHASYVRGRWAKEFICAQGPLDEHSADFWHMIWQENCLVVVMLCQLMEAQKQKCGAYWHMKTGESLRFRNYSVRTMKQDLLLFRNQEVIKSELRLQKEGVGEKRDIVHLLHVTWPDKAAPDYGFPMLGFIDRIHKLHFAETKKHGTPIQDSPILVHCSAGIGRSGTLITLDICLRTLNAKKKVDIEKIVKKVRRQRAGAVQTPAQYILIYKALLEFTIRTHDLPSH